MKKKSFIPPGCADVSALIASLGRDIGCVATQRSVSFDVSYPEFLRYFRDADALTRHHVIIAANFAYGWMPTILKSLASNLENVTQALQRAKDGELLSPYEIDSLAKAINGSTVGASKVPAFRCSIELCDLGFEGGDVPWNKDPTWTRWPGSVLSVQ